MGLRVVEGGNKTVNGVGLADYIWLDGQGNIHVKKRAVFTITQSGGLEVVPHLEPWVATVTLSSKKQERLILVPDHYVVDPLRGPGNFVVLCEVRDADNNMHPTNTRCKLHRYYNPNGVSLDPLQTLWGFQQGYRFADPKDSDDAKALPTKEAYLAAERHLGACMDAGLPLHSGQIDAPNGFWNFKIGPREFPDTLDPIPCSVVTAPDFFILARYFLEKIARENNFVVQYTSCGVSYSTESTRSVLSSKGKSAEELADFILQNFAFPPNTPAAHRWFPKIRLGLHCKSQMREHHTTKFIQDKGLHPLADPYFVVSTIISLLESEA